MKTIEQLIQNLTTETQKKGIDNALDLLSPQRSNHFDATDIPGLVYSLAFIY